MAAPSAQTLQLLADDTGHQPGTLEKVLRLLDLLQEIARDRILSDRLVLKGGTALNLFHLGLDRLSVDIDLNHVGALDRVAMEAERPTVDAIEGDPRELRNKLAVCLPRDRFAAKGEVDAWIDETVALCRERFAFLFDLTANEREFLDGVLDRGEIDADLLDIAPAFRTRIANMPMLAWKTRHVRKHRGLDAKKTDQYPRPPHAPRLTPSTRPRRGP